MKFCIVGKYPPIQGGVSAQTYWLADRLARRGHEVHVVTNADEVEFGYRQCLLDEDREWLMGQRDDGSIQLHTTSALTRHHHVPFANPYATKLFGLTCDVVQGFDCDLIFGWYFEPYAFVATLAAMATKKPVVVRHAGSDLGRLLKHPDLVRSYTWLLNHASAVITTRSLQTSLVAAGATAEKLVFVAGSRLPKVFFEPYERFPLERYQALSNEWYQNYAIPLDLRSALDGLSEKTMSSGPPTIGVYGKIGETKGSFDLLAALKNIASRGIPFTFVSIACGGMASLERYYREIIEDRELARRSWLLPPLPPWRIPSFLRRCQIVCFLERDFPIVFHSPVIPREILSAGVCLVCSAEIAQKQPVRESLVDGKNFVLVSDPKNVGILTDRLEQCIRDLEGTRIVGQNGLALSRYWEDELPEHALADTLESLTVQLKA